MQKILILIFSILISSCTEDQLVSVNPPVEIEKEATLYSYSPVVYFETKNNEFCIDDSQILEYTIANPIQSYEIDIKNKENFYFYCDGYNSAVKSVRMEYMNYTKSVVFNLNAKYKNLQYEEVQKILEQENKKLANNTNTITYILNMQRCQYGFITKVKTIIPSLYLRERFSYELKQTGWYIGHQ